MAARKKKIVVDFDDEDSVLAEMARALDIDPDELQIEDVSRHRLTGGGTLYEITIRGSKNNGKEWLVVANEDQEREMALEIVKQDLENEPGIFNQSFIESHIDMDRLRRDLESDVQNSNEETLRDRSSEEFWKEAAREGMDEKWTVSWDSPDGNGTLAETFASESDAIDAGEDWKREAVEANEDEEHDESDFDYTVEAAEPDDSDIEQLAQSYTDEQLKDPMSYLEDIYGREDAVKKAIQIAGIDVDAAAEDAVDTDGAAHFLSSYDSNSYVTKGGLVYWRQN
jgi:hypothetical protein